VLELLKSGHEIDVILADINMPELDGISLVQEMKAQNIYTKVVILSMHDNEKYIAQSFSAGASGYLLKNVTAEELIFALKHVNAGARYLCSELSMGLLDKLLKHTNNSVTNNIPNIEFSQREVEV